MHAGRACQGGCGNLLRFRSHPLCIACWKRLPGDLREAIVAARAEKAAHLIARAAMAATAWLRAHAPAAEAARRIGEAPG